MNKKEIWLYNLKIHYIWTFFSSVLFLVPIITLYYKNFGLEIKDILILTSVFTLISTLLEIPTSTIWDTIGRARVMRMSVLSSLLSFILIFLFPSIYIFYLAVFFSALWNALWSWTAHSHVQEAMEISGNKNNFWKIIWRLIALENIWKLITPVVIYFVLKYISNWYSVLAWLDVLFYSIWVFFVFKFTELWKVIKYNNKKDFIKSQIHTFKNASKFLFKTKNILFLLIIMIFANDLWYLSRVLLPSLVENWVDDFLSSYIIWFSVLAWILWNLLTQKLWDKFEYEKIFVFLILLNSILHFLAYFYSDNNLILSIIFIFICFVIWIYWPSWNHLVMWYTDIVEKATTRSLFLMILWIFEASLLFILSFVSLEKGLLFLAIFILIWFIIWLFSLTKEIKG